MWFFSIDSQYLIPLLKSFIGHNFGVIQTGIDLAERQLVLSPRKEYHTKDEQGTYKIHQYTTDDDTEALPHILGTKLPWLWFSRQIGRRLRLVHHTRNGAIATKRHPTKSPLRIIGIVTPIVLWQCRQFLFGHGTIERIALLVFLLVARSVQDR